MIDAANAVAKAEDFGRRVRGIAPGAGRPEIAPARVTGLEITEDGQRRVIRGRIGASIEDGTAGKCDPFGVPKAFFSGIDGLTPMTPMTPMTPRRGRSTP